MPGVSKCLTRADHFGHRPSRILDNLRQLVLSNFRRFVQHESHTLENRLRQTGKVIPNSPAEMSVELAGYQVFESCGLVLLQAATPVVKRRINRPGPRIRWRF